MDEHEHILIRQSKQGDQEAFAALFQQHRDILVRLAGTILQGDEEAQDVVSCAYEKAWRGIRNFRDTGDGILPWLKRIAQNAAIDVKRRRDRWLLIDDAEEAARYERKTGGPPIGDLDPHLQLLAAREEARERINVAAKHREEFLAGVRQEIESWPDPRLRERALRIARDERIALFCDLLAKASWNISQGHLLLVLRWAAECGEATPERFTPADARGAIAVLQHFKKVYAGAPPGSGVEHLPACIDTFLQTIRPVAHRKRVKAKLNQYDFIYRLDVLCKRMCRRRPDGALRLLLHIVFGRRWSPGDLAKTRARMRKIFPAK